jgi:hypothetical protein
MKEPKTFDCVKMKWDIQRKLQAEYPGASETERRRLQMERVRQNPLIGPLLTRIVALQADRHPR